MRIAPGRPRAPPALDSGEAGEEGCEVASDDLRRRPPERIRAGDRCPADPCKLVPEIARLRTGQEQAAQDRSERLRLQIGTGSPGDRLGGRVRELVAMPPCFTGKFVMSPAASTSSMPRTRPCASIGMNPFSVWESPSSCTPRSRGNATTRSTSSSPSGTSRRYALSDEVGRMEPATRATPRPSRSHEQQRCRRPEELQQLLIRVTAAGPAPWIRCVARIVRRHQRTNRSAATTTPTAPPIRSNGRRRGDLRGARSGFASRIGRATGTWARLGRGGRPAPTATSRRSR